MAVGESCKAVIRAVSVLCPYDFIDYCPWRSSFVTNKASYHLLECMPTVHASSRGVGVGGRGTTKQHLCIPQRFFQTVLGNTTNHISKLLIESAQSTIRQTASIQLEKIFYCGQ